MIDVKERRAVRHVFISYVKEDYDKIKKLTEALESNEIKVWLDKEMLSPGEKWENAIVTAIKSGTYFIPCFSKNSESRGKTFQRKEIRIALNELALMPDEKVWFIPVKLSDCTIPHFRTDGGISIGSLQWADLSENWESGVNHIINAIKDYR